MDLLPTPPNTHRRSHTSSAPNMETNVSLHATATLHVKAHAEQTTLVEPRTLPESTSHPQPPLLPPQTCQLEQPVEPLELCTTDSGELQLLLQLLPARNQQTQPRKMARKWPWISATATALRSYSLVSLLDLRWSCKMTLLVWFLVCLSVST